MAKRVEDLPIYSNVEEFWTAINAILDLPAVRRDSDLRKAYFRRYITRQELDARTAQGEDLKQMLGGFIKYLEESDWKDRGFHDASAERDKPKDPGKPRSARLREP